MSAHNEKSASNSAQSLAGGFIAGCGVGLWLFMLLARTSFPRAFGPIGFVGLGGIFVVLGLGVARVRR